MNAVTTIVALEHQTLEKHPLVQVSDVLDTPKDEATLWNKLLELGAVTFLHEFSPMT